ncbi:Uncharacterised protein [Mycobacterium tuberculosis]|nr:Uncharacterised protein [Mycobacterium tuberculosis]CPA34712.1 Uncharacterised protein [Mycobacterium tuberculosis]
MYVNAASSGCRPARSRSKDKTEESDIGATLPFRAISDNPSGQGDGWR